MIKLTVYLNTTEIVKIVSRLNLDVENERKFLHEHVLNCAKVMKITLEELTNRDFVIYLYGFFANVNSVEKCKKLHGKAKIRTCKICDSSNCTYYMECEQFFCRQGLFNQFKIKNNIDMCLNEEDLEPEDKIFFEKEIKEMEKLYPQN